MESDRIISEYKLREQQGRDSVYNILHRANQLNVQGIEQALFRAIARVKWKDLSDKKFLDVGCGTGGQLLRWIQWGARPEYCHGIDLVSSRLEGARHRLPSATHLLTGDASKLPFSGHTFDVTTQFTVLSSILDTAMQRAVANEMLRVTAPNGIILSYDFWLNPKNPATRGLRVAHLRRLFPDCRLYVQRITLAPPLCRRIAPISPLACRILESVKLFNSHYLVMIQRPASVPANSAV